MDIERGHNYLCIRDACMNGNIDDIRFVKGNIYHSICDGYLIDENKEPHGVRDYPEYADYWATEHFVECTSAEDVLQETINIIS